MKSPGKYLGALGCIVLASMVVASLARNSRWVGGAVLAAMAAYTLVVSEVLFKILSVVRQHRKESAASYRQLEALQSLYSQISFRFPVPPMRNAAASPDFANLLVANVFERDPMVVVEASSGLSSIFMGYALEAKKSGGKVYSLEHHEGYAAISRKLLKAHRLEQYVEVIYAPLKPYSIDGVEYLWYDISVIEHVSQIDLLVIDGPPANVGPLARFPAVPLLGERLKKNGAVIMDDGIRSDEIKIAELWQSAAYDLQQAHSPSTEKGCFVLEKS